MMGSFNRFSGWKTSTSWHIFTASDGEVESHNQDDNVEKLH